jgi:4-hydroxybenzoate polyprenyltransferase
MRPRQWTKNLLVFAGLIFSRHLFELRDLIRTCSAFAVFCVLSGAVYIINDIVDRQTDREHPQKRSRPIAAGRVSVGTAAAFALVLVALSGLGSALLDWRFALLAGGYFVMQLGYSFLLKRVVVLDAMIVAAGFPMRVVGGTLAVNVTVSPWLFICTILLALFVALAKRRHELVTLEAGGTAHRAVLSDYTRTLLDQMIAVACSATVVAYCLYTVSAETVAKFNTHNLILTVPFVLYAIYRYLYLVYRRELGGAPEKALLSDLPLMADIVLYVASVVAVLYFR